MRTMRSLQTAVICMWPPAWVHCLARWKAQHMPGNSQQCNQPRRITPLDCRNTN